MPYRRILLLLALAALITACAAAGEQPAPSATAPAATAAPTPTTEDTAARIAPCNELRAGMEQVLKVETRPSAAEVANPEDGAMLAGCQVEATGNGREFLDFATVAQGLRRMFITEGWLEDQRFIADGPTGTSSVYRRDDRFCTALVEWEPAESARCPADQPIGACNLAPEQQLYTIRLSCAQP